MTGRFTRIYSGFASAGQACRGAHRRKRLGRWLHTTRARRAARMAKAGGCGGSG